MIPTKKWAMFKSAVENSELVEARDAVVRGADGHVLTVASDMNPEMWVDETGDRPEIRYYKEENEQGAIMSLLNREVQDLARKYLRAGKYKATTYADSTCSRIRIEALFNGREEVSLNEF